MFSASFLYMSTFALLSKIIAQKNVSKHDSYFMSISTIKKEKQLMRLNQDGAIQNSYCSAIYWPSYMHSLENLITINGVIGTIPSSDDTFSKCCGTCDKMFSVVSINSKSVAWNKISLYQVRGA